MMYSACTLNKQGDNIQPWCTTFLIWKQSVVPRPVLTVASWCTYRFLKRQVVWYSYLLKNFPQFVVVHTVKGFDIVNKAEVDVFLELSCFFDDPTNVGNLISGSSDFSKSSWTIWKFIVQILLKSGLENFEHYFTRCEISAIVRLFVHSLALPFLGLEWKLTCSSPVATAEFSKFAGILSAALSQHHFRIWNSSTGSPSPPLALFIVILPQCLLHWANSTFKNKGQACIMQVTRSGPSL